MTKATLFSTLLPLLATLLLHPTTTTATCTTFTANTALYDTNTQTSSLVRGRQSFPWGENGYRVSPALTCQNGEPHYNPANDSYTTCSAPSCIVDGDATLTLTGYSNLSLSDADTQALFNFASSNVSSSASWTYSITGLAGGGLFCLNNNTSGYASFWPRLQCVDGVLSGCTNGPADDGTPVRLCGGLFLGDGILDGTTGLVLTTEEVAANMSGNPNVTSAAAGGRGMGRGTGAGGMMEGLRWVVGLAVVGLGVAVLG